MTSAFPDSLHPAFLPPGTQVGPWRVVHWAGRGVHGAVYRAERIGQEHLPPVALKLAVLPEDPRYGRERELLSRSPHPHIPRLVDHGHWVSPSGAQHPFLQVYGGPGPGLLPESAAGLAVSCLGAWGTSD